MKQKRSSISSEFLKKYRDLGLMNLFKRLLRRHISRRLRFEAQKVILTVKYQKAAPHPLKTIYIDPSQIEHYIRPNFHYRLGKKYGTFVVNGDWDKKPSMIRGDVVVDGHWDKTAHDPTDGGLIPINEYWMFKLSRDYIQNEGSLEQLNWHDTSASERNKKHIRTISSLYSKIQSEGYKSQREMEDSLFLVPPEYDEIRVNIGRRGKYIFDDGRHRFAAVRLLNINSIPVRVYVRHQQWQEARKQIANSNCIEDLDGWVKEKLDHPDVQDVLKESGLNIVN